MELCSPQPEGCIYRNSLKHLSDDWFTKLTKEEGSYLRALSFSSHSIIEV